MRNRLRRTIIARAVGAGCLLFVCLLIATSWTVAVPPDTFYVDGSSSACSDTGPGTDSVPYCTISAAQSTHSVPGTTLLVKPATYREVVTVSNSGASGSPLVIKAVGTPVVIDGADDFSMPSKWSLVSGNVYIASIVNWNPLQVFSDGARLSASTAPPSTLATGTFEYVSGQGLYVNVGGDNPGTHALLVGRRTYGFRVAGKSWVTLDGFTILHTEDRGVYVSGPSSHIEILNSTVGYANAMGIAISGSSFMVVRSNVISFSNDHGIFLTGGTTSSTVQNNESFGNARPLVRAANGINLTGSSNNVLQGNRLHDNQDTGLQFSASSNNNRSLQNMSWNNGDHGYDHLGSPGTVHIGDVAYHNLKDGFSIEGSCPNTTVVDCISIDNGLTTGEFDLWCDSSSASGLVSNSNIFWNSISQAPIKLISTRYDTVSAFCAATGLDCHSTQTDPLFVGAVSGDFHLQGGSPAIDAADSGVAHWPAADAEGSPRFDDVSIANTGFGPIGYADRGALEFVPSCTGQVDQPCGSSDVGDCRVGTTQCSSGSLICAGDVEPSSELCDGRDNDCDGTVDDGVSGSLGTPALLLSRPTGTVQLSWSSVAGASTYDVVRGDVNVLENSAGDFTSAMRACLANDISARTLLDATQPGAGQGLWYAVRGSSACTNGTYDEGGPSQIGTRDVEIAASPVACP